MKLLFIPSSIQEWLLLIAFAAGGWVLYSYRTETSTKNMANAWGIINGVLAFCGLNSLLEIGDYKLRLLTDNPFVEFLLYICCLVISALCIDLAYSLLPPTAEEVRQQEEAKRLSDVISNSDNPSRTIEEINRQREHQRNAEQAAQAIVKIGETFHLAKADAGQPNYHGYKLVDEDNGGQADPLWNTLNESNIQQAQKQYRLYGKPGIGLTQSNFSSDKVWSGLAGERILANMISGNCPNVISFWSLHGLNDRHRPTDSDIDCAIVGQDRQGNTRIWFVDAKNYKGNADTAYRNVAPNQLVRLCISQRAFENGVDGRPDLGLSSNMDWQRKTWAPMFLNKPVVVEWLVCMVPTSDKGVPNVDGVTWPGGIACVTPEELVRRVNAVDLDSVQNIPLDWLNTFKRQLKH